MATLMRVMFRGPTDGKAIHRCWRNEDVLGSFREVELFDLGHVGQGFAQPLGGKVGPPSVPRCLANFYVLDFVGALFVDVDADALHAVVNVDQDGSFQAPRKVFFSENFRPRCAR